MNTAPERYTFIFTVPLPLVVDGGRTMWKISANTYGKGHGRFEVVAECIQGADTRISILDGREAPCVREFRLGMGCTRGTMLDKIVRKLVAEGRVEIVK